MDGLHRTTKYKYGTPNYYHWVLWKSGLPRKHPHVLEAMDFFRDLEPEKINNRNILLSNINKAAHESSGLRERSDIDFRYLRDDGAIKFPDRAHSIIEDPNIEYPYPTPAQRILEKPYPVDDLKRTFSTGGKKYRKKRSKSKRSKSKRSKSKRNKSKRSKSKRSKSKK